MPADSGYVSTGSKNRNSFIQWIPQHSLSMNDSLLSTPLSKHLHSTTRRIFIGPTPSNWSYKKNSLWFSKSDQATHHNSPNRQRTFRSEPEFRGPTNIASLDFCEIREDNHSPAQLTRLTDIPYLVSEPEELIDNEVSPFSDDDIFYTPNEEPRSFPVTPPYQGRRSFSQRISMPERSIHENLFDEQLNFKLMKRITEEESKSREYFPSSTISSSKNPHHPKNVPEYSQIVENIHVNDQDQGDNHPVEDADHVSSVSNPTQLHPDTIIKVDRLLVRTERIYNRGTPTLYKRYSLKGHLSRKQQTQSAGWREYIVKLRPGRIELYKNNKVRVSKMRFTETTRLGLLSAVDYTISLRQRSGSGMKLKVFVLNPKTIEQSVEWYRILYATLGEQSVNTMPSLCEVYVPDFDVHVRIPLEERDQAYNITAEDITKLVLDELSGEPEWEDVLFEWLKSCDLRLCWKRYDRLEWIVWEKNEEGKTHQLQLRPTEHYPTSVHLKDGTILNPFAASPPPPPPPPPSVPTLNSDEERQQTAQPLIYSVAPLPQGQCGGHIDNFMKADAKRRVKQIKNAIGFINLADVVEVKFADKGHLGIIEVENHERYFDLVLNNGTVITLQTYSRQTLDEWIKRLDELIKYWKARLISDVHTRINMFKVNVDYHQEDDDNASQDGIHSHWNNFHSYVNTAIWHWCILNGCRGITKGGLLYHKTHLRGTFQNYHHILIRGHLLYYNLYTRSSLSGTAKRQNFHKRRGCIHLTDCYVYSGGITENDLLYSSSSRYNISDNGTHKLPRIYPDGMYCFDDDEECTFVIWQGEQKYCLERDKEKSRNSICLKKTTTLDRPGNIWVFRARSRIEREEWVWAINVEIERALKEIRKK
ncbi:7697_t:CDS:2 [Funneliformis mosseae]|uniref:7697_t:CDS:1 n=1 Tax=Funneliformis mosseae TaxID=27381 RepID=A0A9N9A5N0_FUNMO|nr:7697_t:CDS:2 [Funneliformis mosseae]